MNAGGTSRAQNEMTSHRGDARVRRLSMLACAIAQAIRIVCITLDASGE